MSRIAGFWCYVRIASWGLAKGGGMGWNGGATCVSMRSRWVGESVNGVTEWTLKVLDEATGAVSRGQDRLRRRRDRKESGRWGQAYPF